MEGIQKITKSMFITHSGRQQMNREKIIFKYLYYYENLVSYYSHYYTSFFITCFPKKH